MIDISNQCGIAETGEMILQPEDSLCRRICLTSVSADKKTVQLDIAPLKGGDQFIQQKIIIFIGK